jgi:hypothetical protein
MRSMYWYVSVYRQVVAFIIHPTLSLTSYRSEITVNSMIVALRAGRKMRDPTPRPFKVRCRNGRQWTVLVCCQLLMIAHGKSWSASLPGPGYDVVIRGGSIYDGSGRAPYVGDVAIRGDRIAAVARHVRARGRTEIDAKGRAVAPGFINMLSHPEASLFVDGRALSDLAQGVTLEVMGEDSMGPLNEGLRLTSPLSWVRARCG